MKKQYEEPATEIIRYQDEDVILTSSHHHCGTGILTDHEYVDTTGDGYCDTDGDCSEDGFHCDGGSGDNVCTVHGQGCPSDCTVFNACTVDGTTGCTSNVESYDEET